MTKHPKKSEAAHTLAPPPPAAEISAPELPYLPRDPKTYRPGIALIGCGAITQDHLKAYRAADYRVLALCDLTLERAEQRRDEYFPEADVYDDFRRVLDRDDVAVVDVTTHPPERPPLVEAAIEAGKHVLSQKPFVLDLAEGRRLIELAERQGVCLAVNQNGRWAPHFSYLREAVLAGLVGRVFAIHCRVHWNHGWVAGTPFDEVRHLILYDFAVHWFDFVASLTPGRPCRKLFASVTRSPAQRAKPSLLGQALLQYDDLQASLAFDGDVRYGPCDSTYVAGELGALHSTGSTLKTQRVTLETAAGSASPQLRGTWFPDGFHGTMGELLCAIEEGRTPTIHAADNLRTLELCFAAAASADAGRPVVPGEVQRMPE